MFERLAAGTLLRAVACVAFAASAIAGSAHAAPLAAGDLLMSCEYWGITRIETTTGEQHPIGVGNSGSYSTLAADADGLVWIIDNRWVVSIDPETSDHKLIVQLPNDFDGSNNGELLPEPGGTLLYAGDGAISRIDPANGSVTPVVSGAPLVKPLGLDFAHNGDLLIADSNAGAIFRWNEVAGISTVASGNLLVGPSRVRQLADGDLLVLRGGRPVRVDPDTAGQSLYSNAFGAVAAAVVASNGDVIFSDPQSGGIGRVWRSTSPEVPPIELLVVGQAKPVGTANILALTADDRVLIAGSRNEITEGVVTGGSGALWMLDPSSSSPRVLSTRPTPGGIATSTDGRLYVANLQGSPFNLREVDPRTGETRIAAADDLFTRPFDAAVETDGHVVVVNGIPNGIPSVLRVDPDTGDTVLLSPTDQLIDPEKIAVAPNGGVFVNDFQVGLVRVSPVDGAQSVVSNSGELTFNDDLEIEASGTLLVAEQAGERMWRVNPTTGAREEVGPLLDLIQALDEPQGYGSFSALTLGLDGTPYLSLLASSAPNAYAIFRAPTDAADAERVSELPLCRGDDLEVVHALPAPEPSAVLAASAALACLALLARQRAAARAGRH